MNPTHSEDGTAVIFCNVFLQSCNRSWYRTTLWSFYCCNLPPVYPLNLQLHLCQPRITSMSRQTYLLDIHHDWFCVLVSFVLFSLVWSQLKWFKLNRWIRWSEINSKGDEIKLPWSCMLLLHSRLQFNNKKLHIYFLTYVKVKARCFVPTNVPTSQFYTVYWFSGTDQRTSRRSSFYLFSFTPAEMSWIHDTV